MQSPTTLRPRSISRSHHRKRTDPVSLAAGAVAAADPHWRLLCQTRRPRMKPDPRRRRWRPTGRQTRTPMSRGRGLPAVVANGVADRRATWRYHNRRLPMLQSTKVVRLTPCRSLPAKTRPRGRRCRAQPVSPAARVVGDVGRPAPPRRLARIRAAKCPALPKRSPRRHSARDPGPSVGRGRAAHGLGDHANREHKKERHEDGVHGRRANGVRGRVPPMHGSRVDGIEAPRLGDNAIRDREAGRGEEVGSSR